MSVIVTTNYDLFLSYARDRPKPLFHDPLEAEARHIDDRSKLWLAYDECRSLRRQIERVALERDHARDENDCLMAHLRDLGHMFETMFAASPAAENLFGSMVEVQMLMALVRNDRRR